ncbi:MAG: 2,3-bisphosphoglycerate-independent phosphoglycerate mutase [Leptospirales bacterium]|nr:2,3-bisphosphoglycerate-independent phosphoglycerate mutase [Leptospirales bacterium]
MQNLKKLNKISRRGPVVLVIMDGVGLGKNDDGDALFHARMPLLDKLMRDCIFTKLRAHGTAVGLPSDEDMGNSEVGHNAMGAGRVFEQGAKLVNSAIESGSIFKTDIWNRLISKPATGGAAIHFIGLLSDGNVHSHIDHLAALVKNCADNGVKKCRLHILLDGRDVPETSALEYIDSIEHTLDEHRKAGLDYRIASGGGRMLTTMDRYEADWSIVKCGWEAHVLGKARLFNSAKEAVETFRKEKESIIDQYLPSFTIAENGKPVGAIEDGDSVVFFNFRGDRSIEISKAFDDDDFKFFDRERRPDVIFAGMMEYDGDLHIPKNYLVYPPAIDSTMSEYLAHTGKRQFAVSETQKFGHVTYFWNGNKSGKFNESLEDYQEIESDRLEFNQRPWMKAAEITDAAISAIKSGKYDFVRLNYPNGDMVGHTGDLDAAIIAAETVDLCLKRLLAAVTESGGIAFITADHGNLDEMYELDKNGKPKIDAQGKTEHRTSHTLNPVPAIIYDPAFNNEYELAPIENAGLSNIAASIFILMDLIPPEDYDKPIIRVL